MKSEKGIVLSVAGLDSAGKSTLVHRLVHGSFEQFLPTIGVDTETVRHAGKLFSLVDLGGHQTFREHIWQGYIMASNGIVFLFDATDRKRFEEASFWFWKVFSWAKNAKSVTFLANKIDVADRMELEEIVRGFQLSRLAEDSSISFRIAEISAKTGEGLEEAMVWLFDSVRRKVDFRDPGLESLIVMSKKGELLFQHPAEFDRESKLLLDVFIKDIKTVDDAGEKIQYFTVLDKMIMFLQRGNRIVAGVFGEDADTVDARVVIEEIMYRLPRDDPLVTAEMLGLE